MGFLTSNWEYVLLAVYVIEKVVKLSPSKKDTGVSKIDEDLKSVANGITGSKGNVTLNISGPMQFESSDNYQEISNKITNLIVRMYELYPTNFAACNLLGWDFQGQINYSTKEIIQAQKQLDKRTQTLGISTRLKLLEQYANPVIRKLQMN